MSLSPRDNHVIPPLVEDVTGSCSAWEACRRLANCPHLLFLDSARTEGRHGVYSFVSADPFAWLSARGRVCQLDWYAPEVPPIPAGVHESADPFLLLRSLWSNHRAESIPGLPPFQGGAAGLWGYDLAHHLERLPRARHDEFALPEMGIGLYDWVFAQDHSSGRAWLLSTGFPERDPARRVERARQRLRQVRSWLNTPASSPPPLPAGGRVEPFRHVPLASFPQVGSTLTRSEFEATIARGIEYVHAGDCFQVNLAQRLLAPLTRPPLELYARLRERNPAPFAGYLDLGDFVLASASPERFLQVHEGEVRTRPIKGTRPRGSTPEEDAAIAEELLASLKDRAENVMIVDLLRNDLGRVCRFGSVRPTEVCRLETYPYVHHLVSEVRGELRPEHDLIDLLRATFPGGSITGAPKIRAMEIIAELETTVRGPYCGSLGYLGFDGTMDTNLLIRTATLAKGWMQFPVGGGIVADSRPEAEYEETLHKARGLIRVLEP